MPYGLLARNSGAALEIFKAPPVPEAVKLTQGETVRFGAWRVALNSGVKGEFSYRLSLPGPLEVTAWRSSDRMLGEDYGTGLGTYFTKAFEGLGGEVKSENFPEGTSDFSAYIQNAVAYGADVIFAPSATTYASLIIGQAAKSGVTIPVCAGDTWESSVILDAQKGTDQTVYCSTFFDENDKSGSAADFVKGFKEWLNADAQRKTNNGGNDIVAAVSALGYDAYMLRTITGLVKAESGSIQWNGTELLGQPVDRIISEGIAMEPRTGIRPMASPVFSLPVRSLVAWPNAPMGPAPVARPRDISPIMPVEPIRATKMK